MSEEKPTNLYVVTREWAMGQRWEHHEYTYRIDHLSQKPKFMEGVLVLDFKDGSIVAHPIHVIQQVFSS